MVGGNAEVARAWAGTTLDLSAEWVARCLLTAAILLGAALVVHKSADFLTHTPSLQVDDSISNVAVALADHGRYGFLASPTEAGSNVDRTQAFFNYGPLYFYVAALLTWLIGSSLTMYRMLHPLGLVFIVLLSLWAFRRTSIAGSAVLAVLLFNLYLVSHWPIARPDIMVSVCATLMIVAAGEAIETGWLVYWLATGFFAASAATTDLIAAVLPVCALVIWAAAMFLESSSEGGRTRRTVLSTLLSLVTGEASGFCVFLVAIDFRVRDAFAASRATADSVARPFGEAVHAHFSYAWNSLTPVTFGALAVGFAIAAVLVILAPALSAGRRRVLIAVVMPSVVTAVAYQLSLGLYGSTHTGYVILSQVSTIWAVGGLAAVCVAFGRPVTGRAGSLFGVAVLLISSMWVVRADAEWLRTPAMWEQVALDDVDMSDYMREVLSPLPERATAWGSLSFGYSAGDRVDLVQFQNGMLPALRIQPAARIDLAPDYWVLDGSEILEAATLTFVNQDNALEKFFTIFPGTQYEEARLVDAPPYGTTLVYRRVRVGEPPFDALTVAVNDGNTRQWSSRLSEPLAVSFTSSTPVTADLNTSRYNLHAARASSAAQTANLPAGRYLITVEIKPASHSQTGFILASSGPVYHWRLAPDGLPFTPYLVGSTRVSVLANHPGGALFISRFEKDPPAGTTRASSGFQVTSVRRVVPVVSEDQDRRAIDLPHLSLWTKSSDVAQIEVVGEESRVTALPSALRPLLESPLVAVDPDRRMSLVVPVDTGDSDVTARVIDERGAVLAGERKLPASLTFDTRAARRIRVVISATGSFRLTAPVAVLPLVPRRSYVDRVMSCRSPYISPRDPACLDGPR